MEFQGTVFGADKMQFWRKADLCLFDTYFPEGLPYTILESMAAGVPVITTRIGGIPEAIEEGVHGIFVEPANAEALAEKIRALLSDREHLRTMSEACIMRARECLSIERLSSQFNKLYQATLLS